MNLEINKIKTLPCEYHSCESDSLELGSHVNGLRLACSANSTGFPFRILRVINLRVIIGVLVLCLFGPLSCNSLGLRFSDSTNSSASKQSPSEPPISKDSGKTEQSKPVGSLNPVGDKANNTVNKKTQPADLSRDVVGKVSSGHKSQIFGLYQFKAELPNGLAFDLASVDKDGVVLLWDFRNKSSTAYELIKLKKGFTSVAFSPKRLRMAVAYPSLVEIYSLQNKKSEYHIDRAKTRVSSLDFNPEGDSLLMGGANGVIYNWRFEFELQASTPSELEKSFQRYLGHSSVVNNVLYHPFGRAFFSTDWFGVLSAWLTYESDAYSGEYEKNALQGQLFTLESDRVRATRADTDIIESIQISSNGEMIFLASEKGKIQVWQVRGFKLVAEIEGHKGVIYSLAVNPKGDIFVSIGRDGFMRVWQLVEQPTEVSGVRSFVIEKREERQDRNIRTLRFIDNNRLVAGDNMGKLFEISLPSYPLLTGDKSD